MWEDEKGESTFPKKEMEAIKKDTNEVKEIEVERSREKQVQSG